jgi:hypothetical protein
MATAKDILNQLQTVLEAVDDIVKVYRGETGSITTYPILSLDIVENYENEDIYPTQEMSLRVDITGIIKAFSRDTQQDQVLDLETDVKKALFADEQLNGNALKIRVAGATLYNINEYPVKGFILPIMIEYRQNAKTRA